MTDPITTREAGYDDVRIPRPCGDDEEKPEGYDPCCGKCVSGLDPRHNHSDAS